MQRDVLNVTGVHDTEGMYSHAVRLDATLYISGQVAKDAANRLVGAGDFAVQVRQVFANLESILHEAGGSLNSIVKMTVFLTRREDLPEYRRVRDSTFGQPLPATTLVFVAGLANPEYLVEVEAIAKVSPGTPTVT